LRAKINIFIKQKIIFAIYNDELFSKKTIFAEIISNGIF